MYILNKPYYYSPCDDNVYHLTTTKEFTNIVNIEYSVNQRQVNVCDRVNEFVCFYIGLIADLLKNLIVLSQSCVKISRPWKCNIR